jgi:Lysine-specific metallo-endopeptidase
MIEDVTMNKQNQWLFEAPLVSERNRYTNLHSNPEYYSNSEWETGPVFDILCPTGCSPIATADCSKVLRQAIQAAIQLSSNAVSKLEASTKLKPSDRDAKTAETARLFRFFFGHDPARPVAWADNKASGAIVAHRFQKVAEELGGGRKIIFRCDASCDAGTNAYVANPNPNSTIILCPRFWIAPVASRPGLPRQFFRAGIILHEMLHLLYNDFFRHPGNSSGDPVKRRDNAHCYEAFALRASGFGADRADVRQCRSTSSTP